MLPDDCTQGTEVPADLPAAPHRTVHDCHVWGAKQQASQSARHCRPASLGCRLQLALPLLLLVALQRLVALPVGVTLSHQVDVPLHSTRGSAQGVGVRKRRVEGRGGERPAPQSGRNARALSSGTPAGCKTLALGRVGTCPRLRPSPCPSYAALYGRQQATCTSAPVCTRPRQEPPSGKEPPSVFLACLPALPPPCSCP